MIDTVKYIRKPLYVDAVRVTNANFDEIAAWCQGDVLQDETPGAGASKKYIKVRVHNPKNPRQTKAFVGDWLLYTERGYKVYTNKAFHASFDMVAELPYGTETPGEEAPPTRLGNVSYTPEEKDQLAAQQLDTPVSEDEETEIQAEEEPVEPTSEAVAETAEPIETPDEETPEVPVADTRQVISEAEQQAMDPEELRELLKSGEFVLAQDLAA